MAAAVSTCFSLLRPFCVSITRYHSILPITRKPNLLSPLSSFSSTSSPEAAAFCLPKSPTTATLLSKEVEDQDNDEIEEEVRNGVEDSEIVSSNLNSKVKNARLPSPNLTVKEKKDLASFAHSLGEKLKSQSVGKSGVTDTVAVAFDETLEKREFVKIKIHRTCPEEMEDVVKQLEEGTGSVLVSQIGRTVILYRPSLTRMKVEEKKKQQALRVFRRTERPAFAARQSRSGKPEFAARQSRSEKPAFAKNGRGRRGSSRFPTPVPSEIYSMEP